MDLRPDLRGALFRGLILNEINLSGADLSGAILAGARLKKARLVQAILVNTDLFGADLNGADLSEAILHNTYFIDADMREAILSEAHFARTSFRGSDLRGAKFLEPIFQDVQLSGVNLMGADLSGASIMGSLIFRANLSGANLSGSFISGADLSGADLSRAKLASADLSEANLLGTNLNGADLSYVNLSGADLSGCRVYAASAWDVKLEKTIQAGLIITPESKPTIKVDDLEIAQFIYLLLNHKKLRNVLNAVTERGVLMLGRFDEGGLDLLQAIAAKLREMKYLPIIFDFDRPHSRNLTETVMTLVSLSRFVIVDLSGRSVANELRATVPHFKIPFVPIVEASRQKEVYSMFSDFLEDDWVLPLVTFTSRENLMEVLASRVIEPAEKKHQARQKLLDELFKKV